MSLKKEGDLDLFTFVKMSQYDIIQFQLEFYPYILKIRRIVHKTARIVVYHEKKHTKSLLLFRKGGMTNSKQNPQDI